MWAMDGYSSREEESPMSLIACHACRKRKVRCGRELPHCAVCKQTSQDCEYPAGLQKPGPKIGSTHRNRKRRRGDGDNVDELRLDPDLNSSKGDLGMSVSSETASLPRDDDCGPNQEHTTAPRSRQTSMSTGITKQGRERRHSINIHDLSFILHPAHEASTAKANSSSPNSTSDRLEHGKSMMMDRASRALGVTPDSLEKMIMIFFDNMTAINLFHEPTFQEKLLSIESPAQIHALLASLLAFAARFCNPEGQEGEGGENFNPDRLVGMEYRPLYFLDLASKFFEEALKECGDEAPQLCVIQAMILLAHGQLTQGVRGKAWRSLGICVRLAYELNLHLVDAGHPRQVVDAKQWCDYEEKRRAWWAIWEMDVFASTVRRCPTAVDWSQNETLLPVEDKYWFQCQPRASCFLGKDLVRRWKALQESGNHSAKAWFIVVNSLMKEAQSISSPRGIPNHDLLDERQVYDKSRKDQLHATAAAAEAREKLETLSNCVQCFVMALPASLKYRNQFLGFDARQPGETSSLRQIHCGLYNIHVMTQLSKLMIHHHDIFAEPARAGRAAQERNPEHFTSGVMNHGENLAMDQYFEAADEILRIVHRSSDDHIQHINAFLASTIWLASAVQLVRKEFGPLGTNRSLVKSKFEVLNMTYKKCVSFWGIQTAMQQNLETLEAQLETFRIPLPKQHDRGQPKADCRQQTKDSWINGSLPNHEMNGAAQEKYDEKQSFISVGVPTQYQPNASSTTANPINLNYQSNHSIRNHPKSGNMLAMNSLPNPPLQDDHRRQRHRQQLQSQQHQEQVGAAYTGPPSPALSSLDFMHLSPEMDKEQQQRSDAEIHLSLSFMQDQGTFPEPAGDQQGLNEDTMQGLAFGWNPDLPSYIDELLSGAYMY